MIYSEVLHNPHFNNLAAIIRVPNLSQEWREIHHPDVPFHILVNKFARLTKPRDTTKATKLNKSEIVKAFTDLIVALTTADPRLSYTAQDLGWFIRIFDLPASDALAILNLFQAWYTAPDALVTPAEIAAQTGMNESTWRNKAANGEIAGAVKKGKQWLLPVSVLRSQGIEVKSTEMQSDFPNDESE
jgi:hypothetical protein